MSSSKIRILDAAERVVTRDGAAHLTLDAVAAEVPMSKGGVLYHFPSKEDLIRGMIARLQDLFDREMERLAASDPCAAGRRTRAYLNTSFSLEPSEFSVRVGQVAAPLIAAVATNSALLEPVWERSKGTDAMLLDDGIDAGRAMIVRLAADGLWLNRAFGAPPLEPDLERQVIMGLQELTRVV
jgi:AcrR family transcriptional regulator